MLLDFYTFVIVIPINTYNDLFSDKYVSNILPFFLEYLTSQILHKYMINVCIKIMSFVYFIYQDVSKRFCVHWRETK